MTTTRKARPRPACDSLLGTYGLIATRLNYLLRTARPGRRGPYSPRQVADLINRQAGERVISAEIIRKIRDGRRRTYPEYRHMAALAGFFGVNVTYFLDEAEGPRLEDLIPVQRDRRASRARKIAAVHAAGMLHDTRAPARTSAEAGR